MRRLIAVLAVACALAVAVETSASAPVAAPAVCAKLTTSKIAAAPNRVAYLTRLLPAARGAGYGIGPLLTLHVRALKAGNRASAARYLTLLGNACKRAGA